MNIDLTRLATVLEKSAAYIEELESKLAGNEAKIQSMETELDKTAAEKDSGLISSLREKGFSDEDITSLRSLPKQTIEKVASVEGKAWDMGATHVKSAAELDPITAFVLS